MMKKLVAGLTAVALIFGGAAFLPAYGGAFGRVITASAAENADFTDGAFGCVNTDDGVEIVSYSGNDTELAIPSVLGGKIVTSIGSYCFEFNRTLQSVTVPEGVTKIDDHAFFGCRQLVSVELPSTLNTIGNSCFWGCPKLQSVHIPDSVTNFDTLVFSGCNSLCDVTLPSGLDILPDFTFYNCSSLNKLTLPSGLTEIRQMSLLGCTSLKSLSIPQNCVIQDHAVGFFYEKDSFKHIEGFTMYVYPDSPAESYAKTFEVPYKYVGEERTTGDVNYDGEINISDITLIAAHIKGKRILSDDARKRADVNGDGCINVTDIIKIAAHIKGKRLL